MAVRTVRTGLVGATVAVAVAALGFAAPASADSGGGHQATQEAMDAAVKDGVPGVAGQARDKHGVWKGTSGVGNLETGAERSAHDRFRVGSITKTFVATVLLQLEAEGRLSLDDKVEDWLPGVVEGNGHDGSRITVRQLLNHTSGIYNYTADPKLQEEFFGKAFLENRYRTYEPEELVDVAMGHKPDFEPGKGWNYSNTNFILAGMVIEEVTGRPYGKEVERRVIKPLGLRATKVPGTDPHVPRPSSRAYSKLSFDPKPDDKTYDVTELNPSGAGAAGEMISDAGDLNRFYSALLRGKLLPAEQLKEMKTTVPVGDEAPGASYGLGLMRSELPCGGAVWGHGGGIHGSTSMAVTSDKGDHSLATNFNGDWSGSSEAIVEAEFCGK